MSSSLTGTVAIVTGASSGIGDATARLLAEHGATVAVVARRKDRLDTLVSQIETDGGGYFRLEAPYRQGREWQASFGLEDGSVVRGPFIHSYGFD